MKPFVIRPLLHLEGEIFLSGDKSIAHRSIIISALSNGETRIENFPTNKDCLSTVKAFRKLGIKIRQASSTINVFGGGLHGLHKPRSPIFVGDSGTTLRLLLGVLAGQDFKTKLVAGKSLSQRPMLRVTQPLRMMGAEIKARVKSKKIEEYSPITIRGGNLKPITYTMPVASAQVKSAIMLAALYTKGKTRIIERVPTRDHTERMLKLFKARLKVKQNTIVIRGSNELVSPKKIYIPGDISSAGFFLVLAAIIPNSKVAIRNVSLNPSRIGMIKVLKRMGADIKVTKSQSHKVTSSEPMGDIVVKSSALKGTIVKKEEIPSVIDELPILMVAASLAKGRTIFEGVSELRVKETDRIRSMSWNLKKMGASITVFSATSRGGSTKHFGGNFGGKTAGVERIVIRGIKQLKATRVRSFGDHRTAMSMIVAGLAASGKASIDDISCINKSFPNFISLLDTLRH